MADTNALLAATTGYLIGSLASSVDDDDDDVEVTDSGDYRNPSYTFAEGGVENDNLLWFDITAYPIESISQYSRESGISKGSETHKFKFLAPNQIEEQIQHEWSPYDTMSSQIAESIAGIAGTASNIGQALGAAGGLSLSSIQSFAASIGAAGSGFNVPSYKVDSPLVYKDSSRRQYTFTFFLIAGFEDYTTDIVTPVRMLEALSCADASGYISIKWPYIFDIKSSVGNLIYLEDMALTSVQPTFYGPYIKGYPTKCDLTCQFVEVAPLYIDNITGTSGGQITTSSSGSTGIEEPANAITSYAISQLTGVFT